MRKIAHIFSPFQKNWNLKTGYNSWFLGRPQKFDEISIVALTLCSKCLIYGEDCVNFCGLFRKYELYKKRWLHSFGDIFHQNEIKTWKMQCCWPALEFFCCLLPLFSCLPSADNLEKSYKMQQKQWFLQQRDRCGNNGWRTFLVGPVLRLQ